MRRIVDCGAPCLLYSIFPHCHKRHDFRKKKKKKKVLNTKCVLIFSATCAWNVFHSKKN
jgi:hypothetical protein